MDDCQNPFQEFCRLKSLSLELGHKCRDESHPEDILSIGSILNGLKITSLEQQKQTQQQTQQQQQQQQRQRRILIENEEKKQWLYQLSIGVEYPRFHCEPSFEFLLLSRNSVLFPNLRTLFSELNNDRTMETDFCL